MRKENCCHVPLWPVLYTTLEAFLLKLICKRVNWAFALTRVSAGVGDTVVDVLTCC